MKFVADEGIDALVVSQLREEGHQVWYIAEMSPGISDTAVLEMAQEEAAILLTYDKDFGDLVFRQHHSSQGVVLIRLHGYSSVRKAELVSTMVRQHGSELSGAFTVLTPQKTRIRPRFN